jgi:outer membrane lipoprotein SlyB
VPARNSRRAVAYWTVVSRLFAIIGSTIGGWLGWTIGARVGFMTAYTLGIVGTAAGVYYGRRFADQLLD